MRKLKLLVIYFIGLLLLTVPHIGCSESESADDQNQGTNSKAVAVEVEILSDSQYTEYIQLIGTIKPFQQANLSSLEGGKIIEFLRDKGSTVKKGDTLVILDNDILKANLDAASARYELAKITYEKQEIIFKQNVNSEIQLLQAKAERDQSKANFELMKARYEDSFIIAPFDGVIEFKYIEEGEFAAPGLTILSLADISKVKVEAGVPERYVGDVKLGQNVKLKISEIEHSSISGKVSYVGPSIISNNRTFPIEVIIKNTDKWLKPEMNAVLSIEKEKYNNVIIVPDDVVTRSDIDYTVYVAENGLAKKVGIKIIDRFENKIAVKSGLKSGQKLITVGYQNLVDGQRVNIVN